MKSYKVVPYVANITTKDSTQAVASRLEVMINDLSREGWEVESVEKFETSINDGGCFGIGAKSTTSFFQLVVFSKQG